MQQATGCVGKDLIGLPEESMLVSREEPLQVQYWETAFARVLSLQI